MPIPSRVVLVLAGLALLAPRLGAQARVVRESEPNNEAASAGVAVLGDTVMGQINPYDVDYWAIDLRAGMRFQIVARRVPYCRDFALLDTDGTTRLAFGDCMAEIDSLVHVVAGTGRYFLRVTQFDDAPIEHPLRDYAISFGVAEAATAGQAELIQALLTGNTLQAFLALQNLDAFGNNNGMLDIGDLRASLRAQNRLP
jgi:hypothetical protein